MAVSIIVTMSRIKNNKGYCDQRCMEMLELNLCDYFETKRKNNKPICKNCIHFHSSETTTIRDKNKETQS